MAKNQVIEMENVLDLQDNAGELMFNLKQLKAVKNEILNLVLDMDNNSADGWSGNSALLAVQQVEEKLTLINLAITSIYEQMCNSVIAIEKNTDKIHCMLNLSNAIKEKKIG